MTGNLFEISVTVTEKFSPNFSIKKSDLHRFIVFVARGEYPLISFSNFARAERLAIIFARLANAPMEVFDSEKEVCYFVEPNDAAGANLLIKDSSNRNQKIKAVSSKM